MADGGGPGSVDFLTHASQIPLQLTLADGVPTRIRAESSSRTPGKHADRNHPDRGRVPQLKESVATGPICTHSDAHRKHHGSTAGAAGAVNQQQGTYQVTVVGADKRAQLRTVEVGREWHALVITTA